MARRAFRTDHPDPSVRRLEEVRERLGWPQRQMAAALAVPHRTYQKWVSGQQRPRHASALAAGADALVLRGRANCWEVRQCQREPGGEGARLFGPCQAATDAIFDGLNGGRNGGRICWAVPGTPCGLETLGARVPKFISCLGCDFFRRVYREEGLAEFKLLRPGQGYTQG